MQATLICAEKTLPHTPEVDLKKLGIVHWFVVSGAHLVFLEQMLVFIFSSIKRRIYFSQRICTYLMFLILYLFCLTTNSEAPIFRAFIFVLLLNWNHHSNHRIPSLVLSFASGLIAILIHIDFATQLSFYLSWSASFLLVLANQLYPSKALHKNAIVFFGLYPLLIGLGSPHPVAILSNYFLTHIFSWLLFPVTILSLCLPFIEGFANTMWCLFFSGIQFLAKEIPTPMSSGLSSYYLSFLLLIFYHVAGFKFSVHLNRQRLMQP